MIHLKRTYFLHLHIKMYPDDMSLIFLTKVYENLSLRELDNSIKLDLDELKARGFTITMAEVVVNNLDNEHLTNRCLLSLKDIPEPVTSGMLTPAEPNCPTGYTDCESCGYWHGEISECEYNGEED